MVGEDFSNPLIGFVAGLERNLHIHRAAIRQLPDAIAVRVLIVGLIQNRIGLIQIPAQLHQTLLYERSAVKIVMLGGLFVLCCPL